MMHRCWTLCRYCECSRSWSDAEKVMQSPMCGKTSLCVRRTRYMRLSSGLTLSELGDWVHQLALTFGRDCGNGRERGVILFGRNASYDVFFFFLPGDIGCIMYGILAEQGREGGGRGREGEGGS